METATAKKEHAPAARAGKFRELLPWNWGHHDGSGKEEPFETLQRSINHLFETFRKDLGAPLGTGDLGVVSSRMDVSESDDAYEFKVELPGMDEKDVEVNVTRDALTVRGEKKVETSEKKKNYRYRECSYGSVERVMPVPYGVDTDKVVAKFKKGVLTVTLPKTDEARTPARKIEVKS